MNNNNNDKNNNALEWHRSKLSESEIKDILIPYNKDVNNKLVFTLKHHRSFIFSDINARNSASVFPVWSIPIVLAICSSF